MKVTVIIPYSVDRGWLHEAIQSVKNQTYKGEIELLLECSNNSVSYNINQGIKKATGDYIKYLCEDDWLTPNSIEDSVIAIQGCDFIHGVSYNVFDGVKRTQEPRLKDPTITDMLHNNVIHGGTLMYKKEVFETVGLFNETLTCAEEYEFNLRCMAKGMKLGYTDAILYNYRRHDKQKSLGKGINQEERAKKIQAIKDSIKLPKVIIAIATFKGRESFLKQTLKSLQGQSDQIRIYNNEERDTDLTDNGKFFFLQEYKEPVYYLSCDDDIIYPPTYVRDMVQAIDKNRCIVTHHGRFLKGKGLDYYRGHKAFRCTADVINNTRLHIAGTGVCGFRTDYFNPTEIYKSEFKKMSDCVFSLEAAKQGKKIMLLTHKKGYIKFSPVPKQETILGTQVNNSQNQTAICDLILDLLPS